MEASGNNVGLTRKCGPCWTITAPPPSGWSRVGGKCWTDAVCLPCWLGGSGGLFEKQLNEHTQSLADLWPLTLTANRASVFQCPAARGQMEVLLEPVHFCVPDAGAEEWKWWCHMFKYRQEVEQLFIFTHRKCKLRPDWPAVAVFPFVFIWMWERTGEALGPGGLCSKRQQLLLLFLLPPLKAVYQESWAPPDKNKGWDLSRRSSVSDARSAQALRPPRPCSVTWFRQQTMMWVNSGRQLCRMFFSLHVVFLSGAIAESSAAKADPIGKTVHTSLAALYL